MKPWQLGDGDNTVSTEQLRMEFIFDSINRQLAAIGVTDQTTFDVFANYIGYSTGGTPSYQDMQVAWTPTNAKAGEILGFLAYAGLPGITGPIIFDQSTSFSGWLIEGCTTVPSISWPNLLSVGMGVGSFGLLQVDTSTGLTSLSAPLLAHVGAGGLAIYSNTDLASVDIHSLIDCVGGFSINSNPLLTAITVPDFVSSTGTLQCNLNTNLVSVNLSSFVPFNNQGIAFNGCALNQASVDQILSRLVANAAYVSGTVNLSGGTNSPPTSVAPGSDYDTLVNRGVSVSVNP